MINKILYLHVKISVIHHYQKQQLRLHCSFSGVQHLPMYLLSEDECSQIFHTQPITGHQERFQNSVLEGIVPNLKNDIIILNSFNYKTYYTADFSLPIHINHFVNELFSPLLSYKNRTWTGFPAFLVTFFNQINFRLLPFRVFLSLWL